MGRFTKAKTLREIIDDLTFYSYRIQVLDNQRKSPGTKASYLQSLNLQYREAKRRFQDLKDQLKDKLKGEIVLVTYLCDNHQMEGRFVNLTDQEIKFLYHNLERWSGHKIEIKEIKRMPTFISDLEIEKDVL